MDANEQTPPYMKFIGQTFAPQNPLYLRKLTTNAQVEDVTIALTEFIPSSPHRAIYLMVSLYDSHTELFEETYRTKASRLPQALGISLKVEIENMREVLEGLKDTAIYNDYLIVHWSATGDISDLVKLVARTKSPNEEVSVTAIWAIETISKGSKIFSDAIDQAKNSN